MTGEAQRASAPSINIMVSFEVESLYSKSLARKRAHSVTATAGLELSWAVVSSARSINDRLPRS